MPTLMPTPTSTSATLEIRLPDSVAAQELQALLAIANYIYYSAEWLERAELQPFGSPMPDTEYVPEEEDKLYIAFLEIGTPNKLTLKGKLKGIAAIAGILTALIGVPTAGAEAYKTFAEAENIKAQTAKVLEETQLLKLQRQAAERLERDGRITEESLRGKSFAPDNLAQYYAFAAPLLIAQDLVVREEVANPR